MTKSATDVMQEIVYSAVVDALNALKTASKGVPNALLRDINAVHPNTTFADLPKDLQAAIATSVRGAFTRLLKEGYSVAPANAAPPRNAAPRRDGTEPDRRSRPPAGRPQRPGGNRPPRGGDRPNPGGGNRSGPRKPRGPA